MKGIRFGVVQNTASGPAPFVWSANGDTNGLVYAIGTNFGTQVFANPGRLALATAGTVGTFRSSDAVGTAVDATSRGIEDSYTDGYAMSWHAFDFGSYPIRPTVYTIQNRDTNWNLAIRSWKLQGTNVIPADDWSKAGIEAATWEDLDVRVNDTTMPTGANAWGKYDLTQPATAYRFFRVLQTGPGAGGYDFLAVAEFEIYGTAVPTP